MTKQLHFKQEEILNKIICLLENNNLEWLKSWKTGIAKNYITKKEYRGVNTIITQIDKIENSFKSNYYLTFLQIKRLKGRLKEGSKGIPIFYYKIIENKVLNQDTKEEKIKKYSLLKYYVVFNVENTDLNIQEEIKVSNPIDSCEQIIVGYKDIPLIKNAGFPHYNKKEDTIGIPLKEDFISIEEYYSTLYHELSHSTGHEKRLNRECLTEYSPFESAGHSKEEIVAELSASLLCGYSGIDNKIINNNSAYIKGWLNNIKQDKNFLFSCFKLSQKSADYIRGIKNETDTNKVK